jgi:hypothetical protein
MRLTGHGGEEECIQGLCGKTRRKRQLGRSRRGWEDHFKMDFREI